MPVSEEFRLCSDRVKISRTTDGELLIHSCPSRLGQGDGEEGFAPVGQRLNRSEKAADLSKDPSQALSPAWHGDVLRSRQEAVQQDKASFQGWESGMDELRAELRGQPVGLTQLWFQAGSAAALPVDDQVRSCQRRGSCLP